jgi:hypothetical protein
MSVRDLVYWLDIWEKYHLQLSAFFTSFFTAYFPDTSLGLSLVLGVYVAVIIFHGLSSD